jgi:hypothetical protein
MVLDSLQDFSWKILKNCNIVLLSCIEKCFKKYFKLFGPLKVENSDENQNEFYKKVIALFSEWFIKIILLWKHHHLCFWITF